MLSRSTETQAWFWRFVPSRNNPPRQTPRLPFLSPSDSSSTTHTHTPSIGAARLALRSNVATVLRIPQHRTTIRRRTVSSRVFASHTQTTNTHAHTLARPPSSPALFWTLHLCWPLRPCTCAGPCVLALVLALASLRTCAGPCVLALVLALASLHFPCAVSGLAFAYALGRASHTNTLHWLTSLSVLAASHFLSSRAWWTPSTLTPLPLTSRANRLDLARLFAALSLLGPSRRSRILRLLLPFLSRLVSRVSCQPSRSLTPLASSPRSLCPLVRFATLLCPLVPLVPTLSLSILRLAPLPRVSCQLSRSLTPGLDLFDSHSLASEVRRGVGGSTSTSLCPMCASSLCAVPLPHDSAPASCLSGKQPAWMRTSAPTPSS